MHGFTLDEQGRKMSKSIGNIVQPEEVVKKYGADTLRIVCLRCQRPLGGSAFLLGRCGEHQQDDQHLLERLSFSLPYMILDKFDASKADLSRYASSLRPEDRWILSRVNSLAEEINRGDGGIPAAQDCPGHLRLHP